MKQENVKEEKSRSLLQKLLNKKWAGVFFLGIFYILILIIFSILSEFFLDYNNLVNIGINMAFIGLMAAAGTPLIIAGGLDLSVASIAGLSGVILTLLYTAGIPIWISAVVSVIAGGILGLTNGVMTTQFKMNPLIVTLGTMSIITGTSLVLTGGLSKPLIEPSFEWLGIGRIFSIPVPLFLLLLYTLILWIILENTSFGRYIYASGGNAEASHLMGVPVYRTQITLYILSGATGAIAGLILAAMLGAAKPDAAGTHLLTVIAAIILGGTSLYGGVGSLWGTLLAILILGTVNNGLTLLNISSFWQDITKGTVLLLAVAFDQIRFRIRT